MKITKMILNTQLRGKPKHSQEGQKPQELAYLISVSDTIDKYFE